MDFVTDEQSERPQPNAFSQFREIGHEMGATVPIYATRGLQFWKTVSANRDLLRRSTVWTFACEAGVRRSADAFVGFEICGIPTSERSENKNLQQGLGIDYPNFGGLISAGRYENGLIVPEDYKTGFNVMAVFFDDSLKLNAIASYMNRMLGQLARLENGGKSLDVRVVLVEVSHEANKMMIGNLTETGMNIAAVRE